MSFPVPQEKLALIDLDGTILDHKYELTCPSFIETVHEVQADGWKIGLSSDTPYAALREFRDTYGMNGPIIAEKGAVVEGADGHLHYDTYTSRNFQRARQAIRDYFVDQSIEIWEGNPVSAIRTQETLGTPNEPLVMLSNQRLCSLAVFFRQNNGDRVSLPDAKLLNKHLTGIRDYYPSDLQLTEDLNDEFGLVIATPQNIDKRVGTQLLQEIGKLGTIAMIGNSLADYIGDDIAVHYAVSDATPSLQTRANYVATQPTTRGVTEILGRLAAVSR